MIKEHTKPFNKQTKHLRLPFLGYLPPYEYKKFMILFDIYLIVGSFLFVILLKNIFGNEPMPMMSYFVFLPLVILVWVSLLYFMGMYRSFGTKKIHEMFFIIMKAALLGNILWVSYMYIFNLRYVTARFIIITFFITAVFITIEKLALISLFRYQQKMGINLRRILIVGAGRRAQNFMKVVKKNTEWNIKIIGIVDEEKKVGTMVGDSKVIGSLKDIAMIIEDEVVDEVVFILPRRWLNNLDEYVLSCEKIGIKVSIAVDLFTPSIAKMKITELFDVPFLTIDSTSYNVWHLYIKRLFDFFVSIVLLTITSPVFIICTVIIKLTSQGPVFFKQKRVGLNGRLFTLYKFRTMVIGADKMLNEVKHLSESKGPVFHSRNDPRVTAFGKILRMISFDELPQLVNVLNGDMSIIGPRPPLPEEAEQYETWQKRRLSFRPGIVCLWQVTKRFQPDFNEWVQMDLYYIDNWSLGLDLKIFLMTFPAILRGFRYWLTEKE